MILLPALSCKCPIIVHIDYDMNVTRVTYLGEKPLPTQLLKSLKCCWKGDCKKDKSKFCTCFSKQTCYSDCAVTDVEVTLTHKSVFLKISANTGFLHVLVGGERQSSQKSTFCMTRHGTARF